jgi:hypothetical protein
VSAVHRALTEDVWSRTGRVRLFPAAEVAVQSTDGEWVSFAVVVDSGATVSALLKSDAITLGIDMKNGERVNIFGIGTKGIAGWRHELPVRFGKNTMKIPVVFLNTDAVPRVLGRDGIFERFTIVIEEQSRQSGFMGHETREAQDIRRVLDAL